MSTDAAAERRLHDRLAEVLGPDHADHLMGRLPPPRSELATSAELALTRAELRADIASLDGKLDRTRGELEAAIATTRADIVQQTRALFLGVIAANATMVAVVLAAVRL